MHFESLSSGSMLRLIKEALLNTLLLSIVRAERICTVKMF